MPTPAPQLEQRLAETIRPRQRLLTAYSGGIDSTLVAAVARRTLGRSDAPAAIGDSTSLPRHELAEARAIAARLDLELIEITPAEQADPNYIANPTNRCYFCKSHLYNSLHQLAAERNFPFIANGTNADDLADHRPGLEAAKQNRIVSPLLEARFTKADVRTLARHLNLPNADKPAAACLASRIPFGTPVTPQRLSMIEQAESVLRELNFRGFRVRHHETPAPGSSGSMIARIEVPADQLAHAVELREQIVQRLNKIGYLHVTLDLAGFRSGSGNVVLRSSDER
ncbi:MAG: ATP-dependent sacrificial sulfur transferase LarE [Phycisphaerales bacterium]